MVCQYQFLAVVGAALAQYSQHSLRVCADSKRHDLRFTQFRNARQTAADAPRWQMAFVRVARIMNRSVRFNSRFEVVGTLFRG